MNRIDGVVQERRGEAGVQTVRILCGAGSFEALVFERPGRSPWLEPEQPVRVAFKESDVLLAPRGGFPWEGGIEAHVLAVASYEVLGRVELQCCGSRILALAPLARLASQGIVAGMPVEVWVPPHEIVLEARDTGAEGPADPRVHRVLRPAGAGASSLPERQR